MPIRFRCRYCNQLMGISRRKAGMTVRCPTCQAEVLVPPSEGEGQGQGEAAAPVPAAGDAPAPPPLVFERSDFEAFLENPPAAPPRAAEEPAKPSPFASESFAPPPSAPRSPRSPAVAGLVLSPTQATWLTVAAILLLALAFGAGLLVGHYWIG